MLLVESNRVSEAMVAVGAKLREVEEKSGALTQAQEALVECALKERPAVVAGTLGFTV
jgi:hypothetical protein